MMKTILLAIMLLGVYPKLATSQIAIIVNKSNSASNISLNDLKKQYLGKMENWESGNDFPESENDFPKVKMTSREGLKTGRR